MSPRFSPRKAGAAGLLLAILALAACSSKDDTTTGPPPGGGSELNSGSIAANGGVFEHVFAVADTFPYECTIHPTMPGAEVRVVTGGPMSAAVSIVSTAVGFSPAAAVIGPGGKVTWTNNDGVPHTVTTP